MKKLRFVSTFGVLVVLLLVVASSAHGGQEKVDVCHITGTYDFGDGRGEVPIGHVITIADPAYDSHIAHGDPPAHVEVTLPDGTVVCTAEVETPETMTVFVTSADYGGGFLGGLDGADAICQTHADAAGLEGTYKAWLSTYWTWFGETTVINAADRLTHSEVPYVLADGVTAVANDWTDLTDGELLAPINLDEYGIVQDTPSTDPLIDYPCVWTGTSPAGTLQDWGSCGDWANPGQGGVLGNSEATNAEWSVAALTEYCELACPLYCFQQE